MYAPFLRMFWKEYRSLRMLWASVVLGTVSLAGVWVGGVVLRNTGRGGMDAMPAVDLLFALWHVSLWLPAIYLLGCLVAAFAGEREERSADWLINLAVPWKPTLAAKLLWPLSSALAMQLLFCTATLLVGELFRRFYLLSHLPGDEIRLSPLYWHGSFLLLEAAAWGLCWSLVSSKPLSAAVVAAVCLVGVNLTWRIPFFFTNEPNRWDQIWGSWSVGRVAVVVALLVVDLVLARQWLTGRLGEWARLELTARPQTRRVAAIGIEPASSWRRVERRFVWLEWQSIRHFLQWVALAFAVAVVPLLIWGTPNSIGGLTILFWLLPLVAGIWAWQGEQSQQQFRCLVNRGVSPLGLWINKFGMWLGAMTACLVLIPGGAIGIWSLLRQQGMPFPGLPVDFFSVERLLEAYGIALALFIVSFVVAIYFRRVLFAIAVAVPLQIVLVNWVAQGQFLVPLWLASVPVMVWLIFCSLRQLPRWYLEQTGWRTYAATAAEWLIFPVVYAVFVVGWWVYAVPAPDVEAKMQDAMRLIMPTSQHPAEIDLQWQEANILGNRLIPLIEGQLLNGTVPTTSAKWPMIETELIAFRNALLKPTMITRKTHFDVDQNRILNLLATLAREEQQAGQTSENLLTLRALVRLGGVRPASEALRFDFVWPMVVEELIHWSNSPETTPDMIKQALQEFERHELRWYITDVVALDRAHRRDLPRVDDLQARTKEVGWYDIFLWPAIVREQRIANCQFSNQLRFLQSASPSTRNFGAFPPPTMAGDHDPGWAFREIDLGNYIARGNYPAGVPVGLSAQFVNRLWAPETTIRGTFAAMAVIAYHKAHGRMPESLQAVIPEFASESLLSDPWSGNLLRFNPRGVEGELMDNGISQRLPTGTPFVWSVGPDQVVPVRLQYGSGSGGGGMATGGMRISEAQPSIDSDALNENGSNPTHPADGPAAPVQYRLDPTQKFMNQQIRVNRYVFPILKYEPPPQDEPAPVDEPADAVPNPAGDG